MAGLIKSHRVRHPYNPDAAIPFHRRPCFAGGHQGGHPNKYEFNPKRAVGARRPPPSDWKFREPGRPTAAYGSMDPQGRRMWLATIAEFERRADDCIKLAERSPSELRPSVLEIADAWLRLLESMMPADQNSDIAPNQSLH